MIQAVVFDLDGTLFDRQTSVQELVARQYDQFAALLTETTRDEFVRRFVQLEQRGYVRKDEVYASLVGGLALRSITAQQLHAHFVAHYHTVCTPFPGMAEALSFLRGQGIRLGIITNGGHEFQLRTIRALDIERQFDAILTSEREQVRKPDPQIFYRALERLGATPATSIFVGDHPTVDIEAAHAIGMTTIWKRDDFWPAPRMADYIVDDLEEVIPIIERLAPAPGRARPASAQC